MSDLRHWLIDVEIDGAVYRWAVERVEVETLAGEVLVYEAGLDDLEAAEGDEDVDVKILDPSIDWPALAAELECRPATLSRWTEGTAREAATVFVRGEIRGTVFERRSDPVEFTIEQSAGSSTLGFQMPDPLAQVDGSTWPSLVADPEDTDGTTGDAGSTYPLIFGFPGYTGAATPVCVVPVPLAQWDADPTETFAVVNEDGNAPIESCRIRNDEQNAEVDLTATQRADSLGRSVRVVDWTDSALCRPATAEESASLFAGFHPDTGGGIARSAYEVLRYVLERFGVDSADWSRIPEVRDLLGAFMVDTWIDDPADDPWAWLEDSILADLPVAVRTSARGRYLVERRYVPDGSRLVGSITRGAGAEREDAIERGDDPPVNEFVGLFRMGLDDTHLNRVVLNGSGRVESAPPGVTTPTAIEDVQAVTVHRSGLCAASFARFGLRQGEPVEIDWTWDLGTLLRVLELRAQREAIPPWFGVYTIDGGDELREGDELEVYDDEVGWDGVLALVTSPPEVNRTRRASVELRVPVPLVRVS